MEIAESVVPSAPLRRMIGCMRGQARRTRFCRARFLADLCWATRVSLWQAVAEHSRGLPGLPPADASAGGPDPAVQPSGRRDDTQ